MKTVLLFLIRLYRRFLSPLKPPCCRFYPTCSSYAMEAITVHGAMRGGFLALVRVLKCHPFHTGGYDPVPEPHNPVCACAEKKHTASCEYSGVGTGICPECE